MSNPLLDDIRTTSVIPTVEIALPTKGHFYAPGEVLDEGVDPDEVTILPISILDESTFADPMMMISGHAISKMIRRVCPQVISPGDLSELDVQAILIASRIASYGPTMRLTAECPTEKCDHKNTIEINLNEHIQRFSPYTAEELLLFQVDLPEVKQKVQLAPMTYVDTVDINLASMRIAQGLGDFAEPDQSATSLDPIFLETYVTVFQKSLMTNLEAVVGSIQYVNTSTGQTVHDRDTIREWLMELVKPSMSRITNRIAEINTAIKERSMLEYQCQNCGTVHKTMLELDPQKLFTEAGESPVEKTSSAKSAPTAKKGKTRSKTSRR